MSGRSRSGLPGWLTGSLVSTSPPTVIVVPARGAGSGTLELRTMPMRLRVRCAPKIVAIAPGLPPEANNFIFDGIDNNETLVNTIIFFTNADALEEFRVITNVAPAEFGRAGGGVIVSTLKSGTNAFHGSAYWFHRDESLDSKFFNNSGDKPIFARNQFGGTMGGPMAALAAGIASTNVHSRRTIRNSKPVNSQL